MLKRFTLIELLIVIGVIAILLTILLPSLAKARERARMAVCASNMAQWGNGMIRFCTTNNGSFPSPISSRYNWIGKSGTKGIDYKATDKELTVFMFPEVKDDSEVEIAKCPTLLGEEYYDYRGSSYINNTNEKKFETLSDAQFIFKINDASRMIATYPKRLRNILLNKPLERANERHHTYLNWGTFVTGKMDGSANLTVTSGKVGLYFGENWTLDNKN